MSSAFVPTEEQRQLRAMLRDFLQQESATEDVRRLMDTSDGLDRGVWRQLGELGVLGLVVPEEYGGSGGSFADVAAVFEEAGRALLVAPLLSSALLATTTLLLADDADAAERHLPQLVTGDVIAALASSSRSRPWDPDDVAVTAERSGAGWQLSGTASWVIDGLAADLVIVLAATAQGPTLFTVTGDDPAVVRQDVPGLDRTRKLAHLTFQGAAGTLVGAGGGGATVVRRAYEQAITALSAEQVGGSEFVLGQAVEYAKLRYQFGRPIGSFQAVKHRCADMLIRVESAKAASGYAVAAVQDGSDDLALAVSVAKAYCSDAFLGNAADNIQVHGGIGYTWEHSAHLYLKRAKADQLLFGDAAHHRQLIGGYVGI